MIIRALFTCLIAVQALAFHTAETIVKPSDGLKSPAGVTISSDGTIYVADSGNHQIKAVSVDGTLTIISGSGKPGAADGIGTAAQLHTPSGLVLDDATRSLYIADTANHVIRRVDLATGATSTIAGTGTPGFTDGYALHAQFHEPGGLTLSQGILYIADTRNHAIRAFDLGGGTITSLAGNGTPGYADGLNGLLKAPSAIAADEHALYIADTGNHTIRRLDLATGELSTIAGMTQPGYLDGSAASALFKGPQGITLDHGTLYVADTGNHALRAISILDAVVTTVAGTGKGGYLDGAVSHAQFKQPAAIVFAGALFVADTGNDSLRVIWQSPEIIGLDPSEGPQVGGTLVTIRGTGFVPGRTTVTFAGIDAEVTWIDSRTLAVTAPASTVGTADITTNTPGGTATLEDVWTWVPPYVALVIDPDSAIIDPDQTHQFRAYGVRTDGTRDDLTNVSVWTSSIPEVATIDGGLATGIETGTSTITVRSSDLTGTATLEVRDRQPLPPDPETIASPLSSTGITAFAAGVAFLHSGPNPIQFDVTPEAIADYRAGVVRGRVVSRAGHPLGGVRVEVHGEPSLGYTMTRSDGHFDMVVNGGGTVTLAFVKSGYLTVHRRVNVPWEDFAWVDGVVMIRKDTNISRVDLSQPVMQRAQGGVEEDEHGSRQATLFFRPGTTAQAILPDRTEVLTQLSIRATEYTVGESGPDAMPAPLPIASGYTYCVELSADEADELGAHRLEFSKPVSFYVDNFLGFPVGTPVPIGYYDRETASWLPSDDGRVIEIVSVTDGYAAIDLDGDGMPEDAEALYAIGFTEEEIQHVGQTWNAGTSLWRSSITHFTPYDCNWPYGPPDGAGAPSNPEPSVATQANNPTCATGSIIECQNMVLGETMDLAGTGLRLAYRSDRVPGYKAETEIDLILTGESLPPNLKEIRLDIQVAGQRTGQTFTPTTGLEQVVSWDGRDVYGRLRTAATLRVRIGYTYPAVYRTPADLLQSFAMFAESPITANEGRFEVTIWQEFDLRLTNRQDRQALGGWTISNLHFYDHQQRLLMLGSGRIRNVSALGQAIRPVPLEKIPLGSAQRIARAPDGALFIADERGHRVWRLSHSGSSSVVAGTGVKGASGDGGSAVDATLTYPQDVALGPDGSVYVAEDCRIRRIKDGIITTVYGTATCGWSTPYVNSVAVSPDDELYFVDWTGLYKIDRSRTVNLFDASPDGGYTYTDVDVAPDGTVVAGSWGGIYIWGRDGSEVLKAGLGDRDEFDIPATEARLGEISSVTVADDGTIFFTDYSHGVLAVDTAGILRRVAGGGSTAIYRVGPDGAFVGDVGFLWPLGVARMQTGELYVVEESAYPNLLHISKPLSKLLEAEILVPSEDGREVYVFTVEGQHLRTIDSLTGVVTVRFEYEEGLITGIVDHAGNRTVIERSNGVPTTIIAPGGQRTSLTLDPNGWVEELAGPSGLSRFAYTDDGLLTSYRKPDGQQYEFRYYSDGRLFTDEDPVGGRKTLTRSGTNDDYRVDLSSILGRTKEFDVKNFSSRAVRRTDRDPSGVWTTSLTAEDGSTVILSADGVRSDFREAPDPRWGILAPIVSEQTIKLPSGLTMNVTHDRTVSMEDTSEPFSLTRQTDVVTVNGRSWTSTWTASDRRIRTSSPLGRSIEQFLDGAGRVTEVRVPGITPSTIGYDDRGRIAALSQGSRSYAFTWNAADELVAVSDPLSRSVRFAYDDTGRVTSQTLPDDRVIGFTYDANDNVTSITPPGRPAHTFTYNEVDLQASYTAPALDGLSTTATLYDYNLDGDLTKVTRPDGVSIDLSYDTGGRLSLLDAGAHAYRFEYDGAGRLSSIANDTATDLTYTWDGFLPTSVTWSGEVSGSVSWTYDNDFRVTSETVSGSSTTFAYDSDSLLTRAGDLTLARNPQNGRLTGTTLGTITDSYQYDALGQLEVYSASEGGTEVLRVEYTRDDIGRIITKTETRYGVMLSETYGYDLAGRLHTITRNGELLVTYSYDANGNRTEPVSAIYDAQDRLLAYGDTTYTYTPNGELFTKNDAAGTTAYSYDTLGNLRRADMPDGTVIEYVIDSQSRRIGRKVNGSLDRGWLYSDQLNPTAEYDGSGHVISRFVYGSRLNVPDYFIRGGVTYRIIPDHLGSVRYVLDASTGAIIQSLDYDASGNVLFDSNPGFQPFAFAGGLYDSKTGLTRFGARDYDAEVGRWISKDPIGFDGGDTNLYAYTMNDPVNMIDPSGLLFGGTISAGESYGEAALEVYADILTDPDAAWHEKAGAAAGGFFSALWTPCTSDSTFAVLSTAAGGSGGWRAAGSKTAGTEFSHWIPDRYLKATGSKWLRNTFGKSKFNGNYVTPGRHFNHDPRRFLKGTKKADKTWSRARQQLDRVPRVFYGLGAGGAAGAAAVSNSESCGCL